MIIIKTVNNIINPIKSFNINWILIIIEIIAIDLKVFLSQEIKIIMILYSHKKNKNVSNIIIVL